MNKCWNVYLKWLLNHILEEVLNHMIWTGIGSHHSNELSVKFEQVLRHYLKVIELYILSVHWSILFKQMSKCLPLERASRFQIRPWKLLHTTNKFTSSIIYLCMAQDRNFGTSCEDGSKILAPCEGGEPSKNCSNWN